MKNKFIWSVISVAFAAGATALVYAQQQQQQKLIIFDPQQGIYYADANDKSIRALPIRENIFMIVGAGGNITVQTGDEGVLVVDSGTGAATNEKVLSLVRQLSSKPIRYIINTSFRPDHTGGNQAMRGAAIAATAAAAGAGGGRGGGGGGGGQRGGIPIVAHENVLARMSAPTGKTAPTPSDAWPTQTFHTSHEDLYFNAESIQLLHVPHGTTDGDSMVYFRRSDVVSAGDVFLTTTYPVIDVKSGGSINGVINGLNHLLDLTIPKEKQEGGTMVIPGHGRICDEADVVEYRDMLTIVRDRIQAAIKKGKTLQEIQAAGLTKDYDPRYGTRTGSWTTAMFIEAAYQSLVPTK
jgi:glyoxylase-like metal-dependent hydrolase (beta-lactamase superfamily II)